MIALGPPIMRAIISHFCRCMLMFRAGKNEKWKLGGDEKFGIGRISCSGPNLARKIDN